MGLQGQLNDVSDSIPLLFLAFVAHWIGYVRSMLDSARPGREVEAGSGPVELSEQLELNRVWSHRFGSDGGDSVRAAPDCIVCLSTLGEGEHVRRLSCRHVFHKDCFDGWLSQLRFSCPLCRAPVDSGERVGYPRRRVGMSLAAWLSIR